MEPLKLEPRRVTQNRRGCGHDKLYREMAEGLWPKPILIGSRAYWFSDETTEVLELIRRGGTDIERIALVAEIHKRREKASQPNAEGNS